MSEGSRVRRRAVVGAFVGVVALSALLLSPSRALETFEWVARDPVRLVVVLIGVALVRPFLAWPTTLLAVVTGYGFGLIGVPFAVLVMTLSSLPPFFLARHLGKDSKIGDVGSRFVAESGELRSIVGSRLVPAPSDLVSAAAGATDIRVTTYLVGTAVGEIPWAVVGTLAGASLGQLSADGLKSATDPRLVVAAGLLAVLALAGPVYRFYRDESEG